jgi:hypothetical protein
VIILELAVSTCVVCLADENPAPAVATAAESNSPERKIASTRLSTNVTEVVRLVESDVEDEVALAYIENSQTPFELSAEHVIYLKDIGINAPLIAAMLRQDTVLRDRQALAGAATGATNQFAYDQKLYPSSSNAQPAAVPEPVYVTNAPPEVTYFYDTLRPYGTWIELESYGWCWQPHVVVIDRYWRPYWQSGRWLWSDLGWYWCSDYSWGWAPFHYGRWHHHPRCGWVWFPDRVWAPAWVCWRYSNSHCGWAPLPPGAHFAAGRGFRFNNVSVGINFDFGLRADLFTFVEIGRLHERHPANHCSFRTQGGPWPRHCVMYTYGASCPPQLKLAARTKKIVSGNVRKTNQTRTPALALQPNDPPQTKRDARPLKESRQFHAPYIATFSFPPSRSLKS